MNKAKQIVYGISTVFIGYSAYSLYEMSTQQNNSGPQILNNLLITTIALGSMYIANQKLSNSNTDDDITDKF